MSLLSAKPQSAEPAANVIGAEVLQLKRRQRDAAAKLARSFAATLLADATLPVIGGSDGG